MLRLPLSSLVLVLAASAPAQVLYGHGTPGSSGTAPRLTSGQPFAGNAAFDYRVDGGLPNAPAALLLSTAPDTVTFSGSRVWIDLAPGRFLLSVPLLLDASGSGRLSGALGGSGATSLIGLRFHLQAIVADTPPSGALVATTNGLEVEVTEPPLMFLGGDLRTTAVDPFALLDPRTLAVRTLAATPHVEGMTGAVFGDGGRQLFVASTTRRAIERADTTASPPTWSTFAQLAEPAFGVALDRRNHRLYTVSGPSFGPKDLVVLDADPASPGFGTELARVPGITNLVTPRHWALTATGDRLAMYSGDTLKEILILDTDPRSTTYLGIADRTTIPGLGPPLNSLVRVRTTGDGRVVLALLSVGYFTMPSGVQRYDTETRQWIDHNPHWTGIQAIGPRSLPPGPMVTSGDLVLARNDSFATLSPTSSIVRMDFDRDDPAFFDVTTVPGSWAPIVGPGHAVTANGHVLMLGATQPPTDSEATLIDVRTGQVVATQRLAGVRWVDTFAER